LQSSIRKHRRDGLRRILEFMVPQDGGRKQSCRECAPAERPVQARVGPRSQDPVGDRLTAKIPPEAADDEACAREAAGEAGAGGMQVSVEAPFLGRNGLSCNQGQVIDGGFWETGPGSEERANYGGREHLDLIGKAGKDEAAPV
jgi:hypothetical protein